MVKPPAPPQLNKPTMSTRFFVDEEWWKQSDKDFRLELNRLCEEYAGEPMPEKAGDPSIDWVDPLTARVVRVDPSMYHFLTACCVHPDFITERTTLIEAVFRALVAAANVPMTPVELSARIGRPADTIYKTLAGRKVFKGIRPYLD
ncbi:MAG: hypothetical protein JXJ17_10185 [Anaerolineae bacterium]|nr:hypothetical protein [Anaerolineae bacterium]